MSVRARFAFRDLARGVIVTSALPSPKSPTLPSMPALSPIVAIVDDEPSLRTALGRLLRTHGYTVASFESGEAFLVVPASSYACIVLDLNMARTGGLDVLKALADRVKCPPVIVLTGHDQPGIAEQVAQLGACAYLTKPVEEVALLQAIESAIKSKPRPA